jgi:hypothetical protein
MPERRLKAPERLDIITPQGRALGGSQLWYEDKWRRTAGCGPTAAANLVWYLSHAQDRSLAAYRALQEEMFEYVTPGLGGVNNSRIFAEGISAYARAHGLALEPLALDIPRFGRPSAKETLGFVAAGLDSDCPVAFLNLSNGNQQQLDGWHWVTVIGLDEAANARISDQARAIEANIEEWLGSSLLGGAFVYIKADDRGRSSLL